MCLPWNWCPQNPGGSHSLACAGARAALVAGECHTGSHCWVSLHSCVLLGFGVPHVLHWVSLHPYVLLGMCTSPAGSWGVTGRSCSAGSWCVLMGHHAPSALPCWVSAFCTCSAGMWDVTHWFCPARSGWVGAGVSLRALALCVSYWESADALCFTGCILLAVRASAGSWSMPHQPWLAGSQHGTCWPCHIVPCSPGQAVTQSPFHPAQTSCSRDKDQEHPATACSAEGPCLKQALGSWHCDYFN